MTPGTYMLHTSNTQAGSQQWPQMKRPHSLIRRTGVHGRWIQMAASKTAVAHTNTHSYTHTKRDPNRLGMMKLHEMSLFWN